MHYEDNNTNLLFSMDAQITALMHLECFEHSKVLCKFKIFIIIIIIIVVLSHITAANQSVIYSPSYFH